MHFKFYRVLFDARKSMATVNGFRHPSISATNELGIGENDYVLMILAASSRIARRSRPSLARSGKEMDDPVRTDGVA
jgi:hypothetical protein